MKEYLLFRLSHCLLIHSKRKRNIPKRLSTNLQISRKNLNSVIIDYSKVKCILNLAWHTYICKNIVNKYLVSILMH